jgi:hypothetical protein
MLRTQVAVVVLLVFTPLAFADDKVEARVYTGHYEKNTSGLSGEASFLVYHDFAEFEKVFGVVPPIGARKPNPVTDDVLADNRVVAVIKRGKAVVVFTEVAVTSDGQTLTVRYKAEVGAPGAATFATPLVVSVPKGKETKVVFVENGKEVGSAK